MRIFIDTNTYLSYLTPGSNLTSLLELTKLIEKRKIILVVTKQSEDEYFRNANLMMEQERKKAIKYIKEMSLLSDKKTLALDKDNLNKTKKILSEFIKKQEKSFRDLEKNKIKAEKHFEKSDELIIKLFKLGEKISENDDLINKAQIRYLRGNPPKKQKNDDKYGDAINWEYLLENTTDDNLTIITSDQDFVDTKKGEKILSRLLEKEWGEKTKKKINLFTSLGNFLNKFEGKEVIKKDVVKDEREKLPYNQIVSAVNLIDNVTLHHTNQFVDQGSNIQPISLSDNIFHKPYYTVDASSSNNPNFCPYCGASLNIYAMSKLNTGYVCTNISCGKSFKL